MQLRIRARTSFLILSGVLLLAGCLEPSSGGAPTSQVAAEATQEPPLESTSAPDGQPAPKPEGALLLRAASGGDGDSWRDTDGREYRLGLINTPEAGECYGSAATDKRKSLVANGFRATTYATDRYGRSVSVVTTASGVNVNLWLARNGYADDRYLARFRHENPSLASRLDSAFAAAKAEGKGLWSACPS